MYVGKSAINKSFTTRDHSAAVTRDIVLDVCIFARFQVHCEVTPMRSFADFKLVMSRHRKESRGVPQAQCPRPWPMRKSVTARMNIFSRETLLRITVAMEQTPHQPQLL